MKLERLQGLLDQERLTNQDMESLGEEILKEKQSLGRELHTLRAEKDRQVFGTLIPVTAQMFNNTRSRISLDFT